MKRETMCEREGEWERVEWETVREREGDWERVERVTVREREGDWERETMCERVSGCGWSGYDN